MTNSNQPWTQHAWNKVLKFLHRAIRQNSTNFLFGTQPARSNTIVWTPYITEAHKVRFLLFVIHFRYHISIYSISNLKSLGALIVYDITDVDSFSKMSMWVKELRQQLGNELPIIIVGNKCDLENNRQIKLADAEAYARKLGLDHTSASARAGTNVVELFTLLTERKFLFLLSYFVHITYISTIQQVSWLRRQERAEAARKRPIPEVCSMSRD